MPSGQVVGRRLEAERTMWKGKRSGRDAIAGAERRRALGSSKQRLSEGEEGGCEPPLSADTRQQGLTLFRSQGANGGPTGDF